MRKSGDKVPSVLKLAALGSVKHFSVLFCGFSGLDLGLLLVFQLQQGNSGVAVLKMRGILGLQDPGNGIGGGYSVSLGELGALNLGF